MLDRYLTRLDVRDAGRTLGLPLLAELQAAHLVRIPFENLDVFHRRPVGTDVQENVAKVAERGRGGWCFELNGAFGWLLRQVGFDVDHVSCRVSGDDGWGPPLDHCALVVHLDGRRWFVDVGFGDCCMQPILLEPGEYDAIPRRMRVELRNDQFRLAEHQHDGGWSDSLWGSLESLPLEAFEPRSEFLRTEPGLPWTTAPFATRATATDGSRVTLRPGVLRRRRGSGSFVETAVEDTDWPSMLREHFGLLEEAPTFR